MDISTRGSDQEEPTKPPNTPKRPALLKKSTETLGNKSIDLIVISTVIISDIPNIEREGQEMEIDSPLIKPITVKES